MTDLTDLADADGLLSSLGSWFHPLTALLVALDAPIPPVPSEVFVIGSGALAAAGRAVHRGIRRVLATAGPASSLAGLFVLRFVSGGRTASMAAAGVAGLRWRPFLWLSGTGSLTWSGYLVGLGWATGSTTGLPWWASAVVGLVFGTLLGLAVAAAIAWKRRGKGRA